MLKAIIIAAVVAVPSVTHAGSDVCSMMEGLARSTMKARQNNVSMSELIKRLEATGDDAMTRYTVGLVKLAYQKPLYVTEEAKAREIGDFANEQAQFCYNKN